MNILIKQGNAAPHSRRDYTVGGLDGKRFSLAIISQTQCAEIMNRLHDQRAQGLLTVREWREEQREILSRTVPGPVKSLFEKALRNVEENKPTSGIYGALVSG